MVTRSVRMVFDVGTDEATVRVTSEKLCGRVGVPAVMPTAAGARVTLAGPVQFEKSHGG
jgi:hypothetical protein